MKNLVLYLVLSLSLSNTIAGLHQAPPAFHIPGGKAVFVDFQSAHYKLDIGHIGGKTRAISTINFYMPEAGYPLFDSVNTPFLCNLNGKEVRQSIISSPDGVTKFRILKKQISQGMHTMVLYTPLKNGVWKGLIGVSAGFFIRDLKDRRFLEKYVPSNLEYDQYKMTFEVNVHKSPWGHRLFANGLVEKKGRNSFKVEFPSYFTSSSVFFHLSPVQKYSVIQFNYRSIKGTPLPITIYSLSNSKNLKYKKKVLQVLAELESDYGAFPHPELIVYGTILPGGMEYAGAIETSYASIGHELQHQYFAKGIMPANGNSGWIDEGIASWRDNGHQTHNAPNFNTANLGNLSLYTRNTHKKSYVLGRSFIAYLDYKLKENGHIGMKDFLRNYIQKRLFTAVTNFDFLQDLQNFSGINFKEDFNRYIFGSQNKVHPQLIRQNHHHPQISESELNSIL